MICTLNITYNKKRVQYKTEYLRLILQAVGL